jgi:hypothetical protein
VTEFFFHGISRICTDGFPLAKQRDNEGANDSFVATGKSEDP